VPLPTLSQICGEIAKESILQTELTQYLRLDRKLRKQLEPRVARLREVARRRAVAQRGVRINRACEPLSRRAAYVVLDDDDRARDPQRFTQNRIRFWRVVQDETQNRVIETAVRERERAAVADRQRQSALVVRRDIHHRHARVELPRQRVRQPAFARADVNDAGARRNDGGE